METGGEHKQTILKEGNQTAGEYTEKSQNLPATRKTQVKTRHVF